MRLMVLNWALFYFNTRRNVVDIKYVWIFRRKRQWGKTNTDFQGNRHSPPSDYKHRTDGSWCRRVIINSLSSFSDKVIKDRMFKCFFIMTALLRYILATRALRRLPSVRPPSSHCYWNFKRSMLLSY